MKQSIRNLALMMMGALISGCAEEVEVLQPATNGVVTMKTTVSFSENASTRALAADGKKTFAVGDKMAVIYKNKAGETVKAESAALTAADIDATSAKNATFTVSLTNPEASTSVRYIYPASRAATDVATDVAVNSDATINYAALATQDGTFASLASSLDLATYDGSLTAQAVLPAATLTNPLTIGKFTIQNSNGTSDLTSSVTKLIIGDGKNFYTVNRTAAAGPIYVAMKPVTSSQIVAVDVVAGTDKYYKIVNGKDLAASNIYDITVKATKYLPDLSTALDDGALVSITYTIDGVEYTSTFKYNKTDDEYVLQSTTSAAGTRTWVENATANLDAINKITGKKAIHITVDNAESKVIFDATVNTETLKQVTNIASEGVELNAVSVNGQRAAVVNNETGYAGVQLDNTEVEGDKSLGGIPFTEGDTWENTADIKQENGGQYLQIDENEERVYFSANGYTGYLEYENKTPVRPKDKVRKTTFVLNKSGGITYKEQSWDKTRRKVVENIKTIHSYQLVTDLKESVKWKAGNYVVRKDITLDGSISFSGNIKLFLCDGCTLTAKYGFSGGNCKLTIYGNGSGKLVNSGSIYYLNDFVIHGGNVETSDNGKIENINLTMYGGKLSVNTTDKAIKTGYGKKMTIYGGEVEVSSEQGNAIIVGDDEKSSTLKVYGGKVTASAPNGQAIKGEFVKGKDDEGNDYPVYFFATDDLSNWGEALMEDVKTSEKHYFKTEVGTD